MKTLVIHPDDRSTDFLRPIYKNITDKTVVTGGLSRKELIEAIDSHDRIIMMGHGCPAGLFRTSQSWGEGITGLVIDNTMVDNLRNKECIFIWCNANQFVEHYKLNGFYTGMFISEVSEGYWYDIRESQETVDTSNNTFSDIVSRNIDSNTLFENVREEYGILAETNKVAQFNHERLYYRMVYQTT